MLLILKNAKKKHIMNSKCKANIAFHILALHHRKFINFKK